MSVHDYSLRMHRAHALSLVSFLRSVHLESPSSKIDVVSIDCLPSLELEIRHAFVDRYARVEYTVIASHPGVPMRDHDIEAIRRADVVLFFAFNSPDCLQTSRICLTNRRNSAQLLILRRHFSGAFALTQADEVDAMLSKEIESSGLRVETHRLATATDVSCLYDNPSSNDSREIISNLFRINMNCGPHSPEYHMLL